MHFIKHLIHCVKRYGHFCQILARFTMPTHQIWSCQVTQDPNLENILFCPNSVFNIRKSHKISSRKAINFRNYQKKPQGGRDWVENTPR